jgi:hypothetical protein
MRRQFFSLQNMR